MKVFNMKRKRCVLCISESDENVSYFQFPSVDDAENRRRWLEFCHLDDVSTWQRLCHLHFQPQDFCLTATQRRRLKKGVVPSVLPERHNKRICTDEEISSLPEVRNDGNPENYAALVKKGTKICVVCGERSLDASYFSFPSDPERRGEWITILQLEPENIKDCSKICSKHFTASDYTTYRTSTTKTFRKLNDNASPLVLVENRKCSENENPFLEEIEIRENESKTPTTHTLDLECPTTPRESMYSALQGYLEFPTSTTKTFRKLNDNASSPALVENHKCSENENPFLEEIEIRENESKTPTTHTLDLECPTTPRESMYSALQGYLEFPTSTTKTFRKLNDNASSPALVENHKCSENENPFLEEVEIRENESKTPTTHTLDLECPTTPRENTFRIPSKVGCVRTPHLSTPRRAKACFTLAKRVIKLKNREIKTLKEHVRRLKQKITTTKQLLRHLHREHLISENARTQLLDNMPRSLQELFKRKMGRKKDKYSPELRTFALTLKFYSTKAYKYVRRIWGNILPAPSTIRKWYQVIDASPGFTKESLTAIKLRSEQEKRRIPITLVIDEMSIRSGIVYKNKRRYGHVNLGTNLEQDDNAPEAKNAFVFMAVSLNSGWKIPVAYFLVDSLSAKERGNIVNIALELLHENFADVYALTFDGTATNFSMACEMGANFTMGKKFKPWFHHPTTKEDVHVILDPSHMLKLVRNAFAESYYFVDSDGKSIQWSDICSLINLQEKEGLHAATKLTKKHAHFDDDIMKVELAAQTLSESVSSALLYCKSTGIPGFENSEGTAKFCKIFNDAFDILNCRSKFSNKPYRIPIMDENINVLEAKAREVIEYITNMKICVEKQRNSTITLVQKSVLKSRRKTGFLGFIISLINVFKIYHSLKSKGQDYMLTYKLSQDHLESFFGAIRSFGGHNNNPNSFQFETAYRHMLVHNEVKEDGNVRCDYRTNILHVSSASKSKTPETESSKNQLYNVCEAIEHENEDNIDELEAEIYDNLDQSSETPEPNIKTKLGFSEYQEAVIVYVGGFVSRRMRKKMAKCEKCLALLTQDFSEELPAIKLLKIKNRGGLSTPSEDVIILCYMAEYFFRQSDNRDFVITKTIDFVDSIVFIEDFVDHESHRLQLIRSIVECFYDIRIHHKLKSDGIKNKYVRRKLTKTILFHHE